jgi:hypothetical protein
VYRAAPEFRDKSDRLQLLLTGSACPGTDLDLGNRSLTDDFERTRSRDHPKLIGVGRDHGRLMFLGEAASVGSQNFGSAGRAYQSYSKHGR